MSIKKKLTKKEQRKALPPLVLNWDKGLTVQGEALRINTTHEGLAQMKISNPGGLVFTTNKEIDAVCKALQARKK